LPENDVKNVLVIGIDAAALARSADDAGYNVFSVDYFGDQDLRQVTKENLSILTQRPGKSCGFLEHDFSPKKLVNLTNRLLTRRQIDAALLASGLDDSPDALERLNDIVPIIGNHPETISRVRRTPEFLNELRHLGIRSPKTVSAESLEEATLAAENIGYPVVAKPSASLGGGGVRKANSSSELECVFPQVAAFSSKTLIQQYIPGTDASVSFLASKKATVLLSLNEQLLGFPELGQREPFGYCGNIVPAPANVALTEACRFIVRKIAAHFDLRGSNGVDIVIAEGSEPYVVEVNPRFQGSLECVQNVRAVNLARLHIEACTMDTLPHLGPSPPTGCWARLILYARQRSIVPDLNAYSETRDRPIPGVVVEKGEPFCSIIAQDRTRDAVLRHSKRLAEEIYMQAGSTMFSETQERLPSSAS
jgi:predicted ATP-grasp superfamily ATP-dependent carboligase